MHPILAIQCFFKVLFSGEFAAKVRKLIEQKPAEAPAAPAPVEKKPVRSEAIALLATLQHEARFVDIVSESLEGYSDAQIGAAARDVLADCGKVLSRLFALEPVVESEEGSSVEVPANYDTSRYRLTGNVAQQPPCSGELMHAGWQATKCELPVWTGSEAAALVVAPAEVQIG